MQGVIFSKLDPMKLDQIWAALDQQGMARATVRNVRCVMSCAMREARRQKLIDGDVVRDSPLESVHRGEADPIHLRSIERDDLLDAEQVRRRRDWCLADATTVPWALPIQYIIETGARRAEALGATSCRRRTCSPPTCGPGSSTTTSEV